MECGRTQIVQFCTLPSSVFPSASLPDEDALARTFRLTVGEGSRQAEAAPRRRTFLPSEPGRPEQGLAGGSPARGAFYASYWSGIDRQHTDGQPRQILAALGISFNLKMSISKDVVRGERKWRRVPVSDSAID